jgi:hypothetical protein
MGAAVKQRGRPPAPAMFVRDLPEGGTLVAAGVTGYGKTYWMKRGLSSSRHLVVLDPVATLDRDRHAQGKKTRERWDDCDLWTYEQLRDNPEPLLASPCRIVCDPMTYNEDLSGERISRVMEWLWAIGDVDIVLEEAGQYSRWAVPLINRCMTAGAHRGLRLFLIAQSIGRITIDARRNVQRYMLFPQMDEADMTEVGKKLGQNKAQQLRAMKRFDLPVMWQQGDLEAN